MKVVIGSETDLKGDDVQGLLSLSFPASVTFTNTTNGQLMLPALQRALPRHGGTADITVPDAKAMQSVLAEAKNIATLGRNKEALTVEYAEAEKPKEPQKPARKPATGGKK